MSKFSIAALLVSFLFAASVHADNAPAISQDDFLALQKSTKAAVVLDVRSAEEFAAGHIEGAINIAHTDIADKLASLESFKDQTIVVYCRSGRRAGEAETFLSGKGFSKLRHLTGDMNGWKEAELPISK